MRRIHCEPAAWHVFDRGARRLQLVRDDEDCSSFLDILGFAVWASGCELWGYVLMGNHYHLVLYGSSDQLTGCMRRLGTMYSVYHNKKYGLVGHAFEGPYQAYRQRSLLLAMWALAYVFYNPVKAGLCQTPEEYPWSGYRSFLGKPGSPIPIDVSRVMAKVDSDSQRAWRTFHQAMQSEAARPPRQVAGRPTMLDVHVRQFEWLLEYARQQAGSLGGEDPVTVAMYWARQCGVSPRAIAKGLGLESSKSVRKRLWVLKQRLHKDPSLQERLRLP